MNSNYFHLLWYFDKKNYLIDMKNSVDTFLSKLNDAAIFKFPPLRYFLELDVMDLSDCLPELGSHLINEPLNFNSICNEILFACLQSSDNEYKQYIRPSQVVVKIRLKSLPRVLSRLTSGRYENIVSFYGILLTVSKPENYVYHTVWSCPEECEGNEVILQYIPKLPPKCLICKSVMFENSGLRRCGDQVIATFKVEKDLLCKKFTITDDLIPLLKLGSTFDIHTVVLKKSVAVWSLEESKALPSPPNFVMPPDLKDLFEACNGSPWKFVYCLASSIGVHVCPLNCFINVKINLILSLASVRAHLYSDSAIVHFLGAGHDTGYVGELMRQAARLADRHIILGVNSSIETALTASSGGVCVMPFPLQVYSKKQINSLLTSLETGQVTQETDNIRIKCAVWAQGMDFKKLTVTNVGSVFGLVSRGDDGEYTDEIADFILQRAIEPQKISVEEKEALKDVANYIDLVAGISVDVSPETEMLLRNYFLAARKERPKAVTVACMSSLVAVCKTSARLCRRNITNTEDAVFAIWLHVCGLQDPRFAPDEYLQTPSDIKKLQKIIDQFLN